MLTENIMRMTTLGTALETIERLNKKIDRLEARLDRNGIRLASIERFLRNANPERKVRSAKSLVSSPIPLDLSQRAAANDLKGVRFQTVFEEIQRAKQAREAAIPIHHEEKLIVGQ